MSQHYYWQAHNAPFTPLYFYGIRLITYCACSVINPCAYCLLLQKEQTGIKCLITMENTYLSAWNYYETILILRYERKHWSEMITNPPCWWKKTCNSVVLRQIFHFSLLDSSQHYFILPADGAPALLPEASASSTPVPRTVLLGWSFHATLSEAVIMLHSQRRLRQ